MKRGFKTTPKTLAWGHDFYAVQVGSLDRKLVGFRVTPKQARRIDLMARASGMTKQDYLYKRALEEEVVVRPDARVYKMLRDEMARVPGTQVCLVKSHLRKGAAVGILDQIHPMRLAPNPSGTAWGSCNPGRS